jgi:hypothetical protein
VLRFKLPVRAILHIHQIRQIPIKVRHDSFLMVLSHLSESLGRGAQWNMAIEGRYCKYVYPYSSKSGRNLRRLNTRVVRSKKGLVTWMTPGGPKGDKTNARCFRFPPRCSDTLQPYKGPIKELSLQGYIRPSPASCSFSSYRIIPNAEELPFLPVVL